MQNLSWDDFVAQTTALCSQPRGGIEWQWKWSPLQKSPGFGFAVLDHWEVNRPHTQSSFDEFVDDGVDEEDDGLVESVCHDIARAEVKSPFSHVYQLHIVYSTTYQVPVLYFNGKDHAGRLLAIDDIWADVPEAVKQHFSNSHISQGEHPVLGIPFYFIHPCNTAGLMALLASHCPSDTAQHAYVINWLSWVAPIFKLPNISNIQ